MKQQQKAKPLHSKIQSPAWRQPLRPEHAIKAMGILAASCVIAHLMLLFVIPRIIGVPVFSLRMWGIHFIAYFPVPVIVAFYSVALALCVPAVSIRVYWFCSRLFGTIFRNSIAHQKQIVFICISIGAAFGFGLFNAKYALLGDGLLRVDNIVHNTFLHNEWGTVFVMHWFYKAVHSMSAIGDVEIVKLFTNICGGFFIYAALNIGNVLGRTRFEKVAIFIMYISFGTMQHFCGYVEVYALTAVVLTVYFYTGILCLRGKLHWLIPAVIFFFGILCHLITIMFSPSLLFILYAVQLKKYRFLRNPLLWIVGFAVCFVAAWPLIVHRIVPELYPISSQSREITTLFSWSHFCEYLNGIVLGCGFLLILTIACAAYAWYVRLKLNCEHWFVIVASVSIALCLFLFRGILGSSDWDTLSFAALAINLLGIMLLFSLFKEEKYRLFLRYACVVITGLMVLESAAWVVLNRGDRSIQRFEDVIMTDPGFYYVKHPRPMHVSIVLNKNNLKNEAMKFYKLAYEQYPDDPRCGFNYVSELLREQQVTPAYGILLELFSKFPGYAPELGQLATIAHSLGYNNLEFMVLKQLYTDYTITPDYVKSYYSMHLLLSYFSALADMSISFGNYTIAESVCNTLIQFEPDVWDHKFILAQVYFQEKRYAPAMNICCDIIRIAPSQCYPYILAAQIYEAQGNKVKAIAVLNQCIDNNADDPATHSAAAQLSRLLAGKKTGQ